MKKLFIPLILGTARDGRESEQVAEFVFKEFSAVEDFEMIFVDVRKFLFAKTGLYSQAAQPWKEIMAKADALVIVSPEYNRGIPGELKILIDSLDDEYDKKPVAIVGASSGRIGGARMAEALLPTLVTLGMIPISPALTFPTVQDLFNEDGSLKSDEAAYKKRIADMAKSLKWYAETMRNARASL